MCEKMTGMRRADILGAMATKSRTPPPEGKLEKATFSLSPRHLQALRAEAIKRMQERGAGRLDASEVLREVLDAWMAKR